MIANISKDETQRLILLPRPSISFSRLLFGFGGIIAEIGSQYGIHAFEILNDLHPSSLYLIDILKDLDKAKDNLKDFNQVSFITKSSVEASKDFSDNYFDLVYIDAEHTYDSVKEDISVWTPKVKEWGIIAGHDWKLEEVKNAVKSIRGNAFYFMGDDWWFIKNNTFKYYFIG
jgi:predicted O-methyltransferase YrrM